jgi:hypothetical protein
MDSEANVKPSSTDPTRMAEEPAMIEEKKVIHWRIEMFHCKNPT